MRSLSLCPRMVFCFRCISLECPPLHPVVYSTYSVLHIYTTDPSSTVYTRRYGVLRTGQDFMGQGKKRAKNRKGSPILQAAKAGPFSLFAGGSYGVLWATVNSKVSRTPSPRDGSLFGCELQFVMPVTGVCTLTTPTAYAYFELLRLSWGNMYSVLVIEQR